MNDDVNTFSNVFLGVFLAVGLIIVIAYFVFSPYQNCIRAQNKDEIPMTNTSYENPLPEEEAKNWIVTKEEYCEKRTSW